MKYIKEIAVKGKKFSVNIDEKKIEKSVKNLADKINADYADKEIFFIGILNGVFMFASDLLKNINVPCTISFVKVASYEGTASTGSIKELIGLNADISGKDIIIIEDIVDTGFTMKSILGQLKQKNPKSIRIASLIFKPESFKEDFKVDYVGFNLPNDFIIGYGLDYDGYGRNLKEIYTLVKE
jgi:hypoxanthine phosphoribosyltransferase